MTNISETDKHIIEHNCQIAKDAIIIIDKLESIGLNIEGVKSNNDIGSHLYNIISTASDEIFNVTKTYLNHIDEETLTATQHYVDTMINNPNNTKEQIVTNIENIIQNNKDHKKG